MRIDRRSCLLLALSLGLSGSRHAPAAEPHLTVTTGTVTGFDPQSSLLNVNTRLGPRLLLVTSNTLILLNDRVGTVQDLDPGDEVEVEYRFDTLEVFFVRITRETRLRGRVVAVTTTGITFRLDRGGQVVLDLDNQTRVRLAGLQVADNGVLVGRAGTAIVEPGSLLLLRFAGDASQFRGRITSVDTVGRTLTAVSGGRSRTFTLAELATVSLNGVVGDLTSLAAGDRVQIAFHRVRRTSRAAVVAASR